MSFVGPRPERKFFIDQIMEYDKRYTYLYQIRPGVTSYATLYNGYTDTMEKMLKRLEYDLYYLKARSWRFDIKILIKTFLRIIFGKRFWSGYMLSLAKSVQGIVERLLMTDNDLSYTNIEDWRKVQTYLLDSLVSLDQKEGDTYEEDAERILAILMGYLSLYEILWL